MPHPRHALVLAVRTGSICPEPTPPFADRQRFAYTYLALVMKTILDECVGLLASTRSAMSAQATDTRFGGHYLIAG